MNHKNVNNLTILGEGAGSLTSSFSSVFVLGGR